MLGEERAGTAALFLFPFDIFHLAAGDAVEVAVGNSQARIYPPFADGGDTRLRHRQVSLEHIPVLPGTRLPHVAAPRLKDLAAELGFAEGAKRADAMRIDFMSPGTPYDAAELVSRFLELARMVTLQWWITRDRRFDESYLRNSFSINADGERLDGVAITAVVSGRPSIEKPLTRQLFEVCARSAARGSRASLSVLGFCDVLYLFTVADYRRFVVEAAVACETMLVEHAMRHAARLGVNRGRTYTGARSRLIDLARQLGLRRCGLPVTTARTASR
jgi:GNAT superfamily N-acetyltransferase